jgi:hypothetical protein
VVVTEVVVAVDDVVLCTTLGSTAVPCVPVVFAGVVIADVVALLDVAGETTWLLATNTVVDAIASAARADRIRNICCLSAPLLPRVGADRSPFFAPPFHSNVDSRV